MISTIQKKPIKKILVSVILAFLISYTAALRFTNFLMFTKSEKAILLAAMFLIISLPVFFLIEPFFAFLQRGILPKLHLILLIIAFILTLFLFTSFYRLPFFPQTLNLEITRNDSPNPGQHSGEIKILSITRVDLPSEHRAPVNVAQLAYDAPWFSEENQLETRHEDKSTGSVKYSRFVQSRLEIVFQTGPNDGTVNIHWNGQQINYDLHNPTQGTKLVQLNPTLSWARADLTRKAFLSANFISEFLLLSFCLYVLGLIIVRLFIMKDISVRGIGVIFAVIVISSGFLFLNNRLQTEVHFHDPNLENVVRLMINNPENPIYQHQLLTIATLDANHQGITDLKGIEALKNIKALNLSGNTISDLTPLSHLKKLSDLDLSENQILDLRTVNFEALEDLPLERLILRNNISQERVLLRSGLSNIQILGEFETLHELDLGVNHIQDISALADLDNLSILSLDSNKISDLRPLEKLNRLQYINLALNDITDISPLKNLTHLQYLNLSSDVKIVDLSPLNNLDNLEDLNLNNIYTGNALEFLRNKNHLYRLELQNCGISDLSEIGLLMAKGMLQDDPDHNRFAEVNLRDNPLEVKEEDSFAPLRKYWQHISDRDPVELPPYNTLSEPSFSENGGFYTKPFDLKLKTENPDSIILYSVDGSEPHIENVKGINQFQQTKIYTQPIKIKSRQGDPNVFSMFNTANVVNSWLPLWSPPKGEVFKTNVIRAMTYDPISGEHSAVVTHTYFVDKNISERYKTLPIISLTSDYQYLFDPETGIYSTGILTGLFEPPFIFNESIVPANIEFFNPDGTLGFNSVYEIQLQGSTSRSSPQKGLMVSTNIWYGEEMINYPIFSNGESDANQIASFKQFIIRSWGSARDWPVIFSDAYHQTLMAKSDQDIQDYQPVIVFINGEYWGLHELREADKNSWYHQAHTGIDRIDPGYDLLDGGYDLVDEGSAEDWDNLMAFIETHDITIPENYQYVESKIDIDNFIHYMIHCIYTGKRDWPDHNESKWRVRSEDGKWRWIQYDMDHGLSHFGRPEYDMIYHTIFDEDHYHPLLVTLLQNEEFKLKFLNYFADDLNTYFLKDVEVAHFKEMVEELEPYIPEYQARWQLNQNWDEGIEEGLEIVKERNGFRWDQLINDFKLEGTVKITFKTDSTMGLIQVNSVTIDQNTPGIEDPSKWRGTYIKELPIQVSAVPAPGYHFVRWEGLTANDNTAHISITPTKNMTITAIFAPDE